MTESCFFSICQLLIKIAELLESNFSNKMKRIAIIGAGASGLIASLFASRENKVTLYEKQKKIGRKILATGNGRCNISNRNIDISRYHGNNTKFLLNVFSKFGLPETIEFFNSLGIPFVEEDEGKLFPASMQASSITKIFEYELNKNAVEVMLHKKIEEIVPLKNKFKIITAGREEFLHDSVILSAGSCASSLGASGIGYQLAASLGHKVFEPFPAILPLSIPLKAIHVLEGIKCICTVSVRLDSRTLCESSGELLFTKSGLSGPAALNVSRTVNHCVISGRTPEVIIDFFPGITESHLSETIDSLWSDKNKPAAFSFAGIMKNRLPDVLIKLAGVDPQVPVGQITKVQKEKIIKTFKSLSLAPGKPGSFNDAVVAAGGIDVNEINPATMESLILKNLYITGELLDIDGDSGGYNLQFAWSTGALAGMSQ